MLEKKSNSIVEDVFNMNNIKKKVNNTTFYKIFYN